MPRPARPRRYARFLAELSRAEAGLGHSVVIVALGAEPLLLLPDSLLLLPLMKFPPATPATAVLLANKATLVSATGRTGGGRISGQHCCSSATS